MMSLVSCTALSLIFFLMIRRLSRSTLFPYTRSSDLTDRTAALTTTLEDLENRAGNLRFVHKRMAEFERSEEHTSELQSHLNLVCRLLREKKNSQARAGCQRADDQLPLVDRRRRGGPAGPDRSVARGPGQGQPRHRQGRLGGRARPRPANP